jgi:hypothetical protein
VIAFQNTRLPHDGRKVGDRLFVDDRVLSGKWLELDVAHSPGT